MTTANAGTDLPTYNPDSNTFNRFGKRQEPRTPGQTNAAAVYCRRKIEELLEQRRQLAEDSF